MSDQSHNSHVSFSDAITGEDLQSGQLSKSNHRREIKSEHPINDAEDLPKRAHLQSALRDVNMFGKSWDENKKEKFFNRYILKYAEETLSTSGIDNADIKAKSSQITVPRVHVLLLVGARETTIDKFTSAFDDLYDLLGVDGGLSAASLYRCSKQMKKYEQFWKSFINATSRVFYAYYRTGAPIPDSVRDAHITSKPEYSPIVREEIGLHEAFSAEERREAILNWCELLIPACIEPISFDRGANASYNKYSIIGSLVHAALQSTSVNNSELTLGGWLFDPELVSSGDNVLKQIEKLSISSISKMFANANQEFFYITDQYVNFPDRVRIAYDPTCVLFEDSEGREVPADGWIKGHTPSVKANMTQSGSDYKWDFGVISMINSSEQYCLGAYPVGKDVKDGDVIERILRQYHHESHFGISQLVMDRGMVSADVVKHARNVVGDKWLLHGKQEHGPGNIVEETPTGESVFDDDVDYLHDLTQSPNVIVVPIKGEQETDDSHRVFLIDLDEGEIVPSTLNHEYRRRKRIESSIGIIKNMMPKTRSSKIEVRYFLFSLGMLLHNCTKLMNEALSPEYALPLGSGKDNRVRMDEVLTGVRKVCFQIAEDKAN